MPGYRTYQTFDEFFNDQSADKQKIITALRHFVERTVPNLRQGSKWGNGVWFKGDLPVAFVYAKKGPVQFGFFGGSLLNDPDKLLEGGGKYIRHIKIRSPQDINKQALISLVRQASKTNYKPT